MNSLKIIQILKKELKSKGLTYKDISTYLKMSEAGVKKLLSKNDISFNRLELLCDLLQKSPSEIIKIAQDNGVESHSFTDKQIKFFLSHQHYFHFYMKLAYEQKKPQVIQSEFNLSNKSLNLYLKKLEELNLIKRHPYERLQIIGGSPLAIKTTGTELELMKYDIAIEQLKILKDKKSDDLSGAGLFLTDYEKEELLEKVLKTIIEFSSVSRTNRKKENQIAKEYNFMAFLNTGSMFDKIIEVNK
jgi:transcriptional regulator with XRE-family HTH domain